ncbi:MAG TPA: glycosyltransferase, partial [Acetobacteraceae bacterium]|nr:glycosyltransferase [Acetobacteraceae bacterium]
MQRYAGAELASYRPDLIIADMFGPMALQAAIYCAVSRRSRLLLYAAERPRRFGLRERAILRTADGVLADGEAAVQAVLQAQVPASRIYTLGASCGVDSLLARRRLRGGAEAHRLVFAGDLSPQSGAADLFMSVAHWTEQNPGRSVEIWWIGEGDLAGILQAQPLPATMKQRFLGALGPSEMESAFDACGVLAVPSLADGGQPPIREAIAAGLPVLGSRRNRLVRQLVHEGINGWLFDPLRPQDMALALGRALGSAA